MLPAVVRAVVQLLNRLENDKIDGSAWNEFLKLESHWPELGAVEEHRPEVTLMSEAAKAYSTSTAELSLISEIFGRVSLSRICERIGR